RDAPLAGGLEPVRTRGHDRTVGLIRDFLQREVEYRGEPILARERFHRPPTHAGAVKDGAFITPGCERRSERHHVVQTGLAEGTDADERPRRGGGRPRARGTPETTAPRHW